MSHRRTYRRAMHASDVPTSTPKARRRAPRSSHAQAETLLWRRLQRSRLPGRTFRRRQSVGPYVLDFYCPEARLAVALDDAAPAHDGGARRDVFRTAYLAAAGVRVLRVEDREVVRDLDGVLASIARCCAGHASRVHVLSDD